MSTHLLIPRIFHYTFGPHEPALCIDSGDSVIAETRDAFGLDSERNPLPEKLKHRVAGTVLRESNPVVGPIYVDGAEEGDLLAIHIRRIDLTRDFAISKQTAHFGSLTGEWPGHRLLYNDPVSTVWQMMF